MLQEFPDAPASLRFRRVTTPQLVDIIIGDFTAQQAGRYELKEQATPLFGNTQTLMKAALQGGVARNSSRYVLLMA